MVPLRPLSVLPRQGVMCIPLRKLPRAARAVCAVLLVRVLRRLARLILLQLEHGQTHSTSVTLLL